MFFCTNPFLILIHPQVTTKDNFCNQHNFPNICPYIESLKSRNYNLVIFRRFLNFGPFFGPFSGTAVENARHKKVAPDINLNFLISQKVLALIFRSVNCVFPKCTFSGPQLNRLGLEWYLLNSSKAFGHPCFARA